jgi:trk system potassium uptake protein TrkA
VKVLIAGAGRLGMQVAQVLARDNDLTLIDPDEHRLSEVRGHIAARLLLGDAGDPSVLEEAGAAGTDLLIAATGADEDNLVISLLAKKQFDVPRIVARVNDTDNAWLFDAHWGVDVAVPAATPLVSLIEEATGSTDTVALLRLSKAGVDVIETAISPQSRAAGRALADIALPSGSVVAAVIRGGNPTVPTPDYRLQPGDELLVISHDVTSQAVHAAFQ